MKASSWLEISKYALEHNLRQIRKHIGPHVLLGSVVKANAYGHSMINIAKIAVKSETDFLLVVNISEAIRLREENINAPVLVLGAVQKKEFVEKAAKEGIHLTICSGEDMDMVSDVVLRMKKFINIHLKIETGMHRLGVLPKNIVFLIKRLKKNKFIRLAGIYSHMSNADSLDRSYTSFQIKVWRNVLKKIKDSNIHIPIKHICNSAGMLLRKDAHYDLVRTGISMYGLMPSNDVKVMLEEKKEKIRLYPVLSWKTHICHIKEVKKGAYVGYSCSYTANRKSRIAVVPVGYFDGYFRHLSNNGYVLVHGSRAPIRGNICMDMFVFDVTDIPGVKIGDEVVLIGKQGKEYIGADDLAKLAGTINYEIVARIREGLPRIIIE